MIDIFTNIISSKLGLGEKGVANTLRLLDDKCTIPFISRYRKELTGNLDEIKVAEISVMREKLLDVAKRKDTIVATIEEQNKMTEQLRARIDGCWEMQELEDIYQPYKPHRQTKADVARQQGLEPLANVVFLQRDFCIKKTAAKFLSQNVKTIDEALIGAKYIIAERINENELARKIVRGFFRREAVIVSSIIKTKVDEQDAQKYRDYFDFSEKLSRCTSHRLLAMRRGEKEGFLRVKIRIDDEECIKSLCRQFVSSRNDCGGLVSESVSDAFKRLLKPSVETEFAALSKLTADQEAIDVFSENLRQLLLAAPLGQKRIMGVDPGIRTGCKVVCLDAQGNLLHFEAIYPHAPRNDKEGAAARLRAMASKYKIEAIAIGNGTASRETTSFIKSLSLGANIHVYVVSEDGASVYSASEVARDEFPDKDVTVRGAVSIGRRLIDPLSELVKIDPKSIGVGQYQHDVDQTLLKKSLDMVVESCVNTVGVNLNTASKYLLSYVSGLNATTAKNIVAYRDEHGPFLSRSELKKVPRLGAVAFQQCAGFLRIPNAKDPLDNSAVHPESYAIVRQMAKDSCCSVAELIGNKEKLDSICLGKYVNSTIGMPTLTDIIAELKQPGRDPRTEIETFEFDPRVHEISDLQVGALLPGIVTNITKFGAFVDVGVHTDGLVHISQLANRYVKDPAEVVKLQQHVIVRVIEVDVPRRRISLSMKE